MLLACVFMAQPLLAIASAFGSACAGTADCCCVQSPSVPVLVVERAASCCASERADASEPPPQRGGPVVEEHCDCRADSAPVRPADPALPAVTSHVAGDAFLAEWVQEHARIAHCTPSGPPGVRTPPGAWEAGPGRDARFGAVPGSPAGEVSSASARAVQQRGVAGLLAVLSIARL